MEIAKQPTEEEIQTERLKNKILAVLDHALSGHLKGHIYDWSPQEVNDLLNGLVNLFEYEKNKGSN